MKNKSTTLQGVITFVLLSCLIAVLITSVLLITK